ncbi:nucleotidyltransferase [Parasporobacterium paucivorans]|uniref:tRNA(Met) cytidine acetate ligase n=1 Tax=Parasporobacterium paucivorans DSM 15970 TaxID=1122934 RepID=A0A1M6F5G0_9FIRM|nr:nucleotidyltransferase [Parasporobacterium paucivorans]SHI92896.1 Predicted nucleotidyltransferase [Parasporobacterium paucivorans DSM 15970]
MSCVGIVVEFNPFHNGHLYLIDKAREVTGADFVVVVMSGNYVQRGGPAFIDKYSRARACLENGVDLVIELPVYYATASAEYFASGAISLLDNLGIVDYIAFGSECGNQEDLHDISAILSGEPEEFKRTLKECLSRGMTFPSARVQALLHCAATEKKASFAEILSSPNNILSIEYLKALSKRNSKITPVSIPRIGAGYHDEALSSCYSSATSIRRHILSGSDTHILKDCMPPVSYNILSESMKRTGPIVENDFSSILGEKILLTSAAWLSDYFDVSDEIARRMENNRYSFINYNQFTSLLKTRDITEAHVRRALLHILLGIRRNKVEACIQEDYVSYIRILGFKKASSSLLTLLKEKTKLPIITKTADAFEYLGPNGRIMFEDGLNADHLYRLIAMDRSETLLPNEFTNGLVIL